LKAVRQLKTPQITQKEKAGGEENHYSYHS